ncbi:hypothetical protein [Vallicoccus soli]|uniref:Uncharacterized protein n=1 Tax=Vallicoccus soli TaxID=2339232 RepID=A0A3A3ZHQ2_9ACTN|nr:hypothetical protein [Vallicoccus soli]RJK94816.1 hypothetical protein D5H78_13455 [Vallicoccus soli]
MTERSDAEVLPLRPAPRRGTVLLDQRGGDRALRVSWHDEDDLVVLSVWRGERCTATFRLAAADVPALVDALVAGLAARRPGVAGVNTA